jgi:transposase
MANQYTGSFEHIVKDKYNCTAQEALIECQKDGLSYAEAGEKLGFKHGTIRKWANKLDIKLRAGDPPKLRKDQFLKLFRSETMNQYNVLSRSWLANIKIA